MSNTTDYDQGIERLNNIIDKLESGELTLEENISLYEEGIKLYNKLKKILKEQEGRIIKIQEGEEIEFEQISIIPGDLMNEDL